MATVLDIVTRAYRKTAISAEGETLTSEAASEGLSDLNMMLAAWKLAGVDTTHTALALSDAFPLAAEFEEGTVYMLAGRIVPGYQAPLSFDPDDFFRKIQAAYAVIDAATMPTPLSRMPSQYWPRTGLR